MKHFLPNILATYYLILYTCTANAQELYYQSTYKGGVSYDGKSYVALDWQNADSIKFQNSVPTGCTIKKAFLISLQQSCITNNFPVYDIPVSFNYNNHVIQFDTTDIATPLFYSRAISNNGKMWMAVKDVTTLTQTNNNILAIPLQSYGAFDCNYYYFYDGFYLLLLYENNTYSNVNVALYLNNMTYVPTMNYALNALNPINTANDVGLSIESVNDNAPPYSQYQLTSSVSTVTLGTLRDVSLSGNTDYDKGLGSFYYQNGVLTGLNGNINSPFIDSTDALCNIKTYLANNTTTFSLTANISTSPTINGNDGTEAFILAYSTPCPSVSNNADSIKIYKLCAGQSVQLNASMGYSSYNWYPSTSLSNTNTANPNVLNAQYTTNYICTVKDAAGCMHTEHAQVIVHQTPAPQSLITTTAICGSTQGTLTITPNYHHYGYVYSLNGSITQTDSTFSNLIAGHYTLTITDSFNCAYKDTFSIKQVNLAQASFYPAPYNSGCPPLSITCNNIDSTTTNAQTWYVNGDSTTSANFNYTFTDTGTYSITLLAYESVRTCSATATQTVDVKYCPPDSISIKVPNVFSPNGDNVNDTWQLIIFNRNYTISNYQCTIYDRWGLKVFTSTLPDEGWTGRTTSGIACSADTYYYYIKITETNSKSISKATDFMGFLELVR